MHLIIKTVITMREFTSNASTSHEFALTKRRCFKLPHVLGDPSQTCNGAAFEINLIPENKERPVTYPQWTPHCAAKATLFIAHEGTAGGVMQAGSKLLSKPRAVEFGSPSPERASAAKVAQEPKIRLVRPSRWPPRGRCSAETLVAPESLPCQRLEDIGGGVRVHKALSLPVGLLMLAQSDTILDQHMSAGSLCGCI